MHRRHFSGLSTSFGSISLEDLPGVSGRCNCIFKVLEDNLKHEEEILYVLRGDGLSLKLLKCNFFKELVDYLAT